VGVGVEDKEEGVGADSGGCGRKKGMVRARARKKRNAR